MTVGVGAPRFARYIFTIVAALAGCVPVPADEPLLIPGVPVELASQLGVVTVRVELLGQLEVNPLALGVKLTPMRGSGVATLSQVGVWMPSHGHWSREPKISSTEYGYRVDDILLTMPGRWQFQLHVSLDGIEDLALVSVDAP